jgi:hypothetical protein
LLVVDGAVPLETSDAIADSAARSRWFCTRRRIAPVWRATTSPEEPVHTKGSALESMQRSTGVHLDRLDGLTLGRASSAAAAR